MKIDISDEKIVKFRELVNDNSSFVCKEYKNKNGKNLWHPICSCMDWITVSIRFFQEANELSDNIDVKVMQLYSIISAIDIVSESITQLHRVFINQKSVPFKGDKSIFKDRLFENDDNDYFKQIRASYGAHPVNLNPNKSKEQRYFASWPFGSFTGADLDVRLYSNNPDESDLTLPLNLNELISFLKSRYDYLDVIEHEIIKQFSNFKEEYRFKAITMSSDPLQLIHELRKESILRLDNDYYNEVINDLTIIFSTSLGDEYHDEETKFKESLLPLIGEIRSNLQDVNIKDLEHHSLIYIDSTLDSTLSYELPKFYSWLYHGRPDPMLDYYINKINKVSNNQYKFDKSDGRDETFLKLKLMLKMHSI